MSYGIFLGYRQGPGSVFGGQYIVADIEDFVGNNMHIDATGAEFRVKPHITEQIRLGKRGVCFPLKNAYDRANLTLEGQEGAIGEHHHVTHDLYGVPNVMHKLKETDFEEPDATEEVEKVNRQLALQRVKKEIDENPDALMALEEGSDEEEFLGGEDEDPDVPINKIIRDIHGNEKTIKVDRFGTMMTKKTPRKIPYYTNEQWREIAEPTRIVMLKDWDKR